MIATSSRFILFLGKTVWGGKYHDFTLLKEEFKKEKVFEDHQVWVDLAYVGFSKYYKTKKLHLPYKKPRKTKTRPDPKLTDFQKQSIERVITSRKTTKNLNGNRLTNTTSGQTSSNGPKILYYL